MNAVTIRAFGDELEKLAVVGALKKYLHTGWNIGSENYPEDISSRLHGWVGTGPQIDSKKLGPGIGNMVHRGWQKSTGLWGGTKYLPLGAKALTVGFALPEVYSALKRDDPSGQGRSRTERVSGLAGSTIGGMLGAGAGKIHGGGWSTLFGGIGGSMLGSRIANLPFRAEQQRRKMEPPRQYAAYPRGWGSLTTHPQVASPGAY